MIFKKDDWLYLPIMYFIMTVDHSQPQYCLFCEKHLINQYDAYCAEDCRIADSCWNKKVSKFIQSFIYFLLKVGS